MTNKSPRQVSSAAELLQDVGVDIEAVHFWSLSAEIRDPDPDGPPLERLAEVEPRYGLKIRHEGREIGIRVSAFLDLGIGEIKVDASVDYVAAEDVTMAEATRLDFANNVGLMALLPFIRQAVADLSQRVFGEILLMPVLQRGELSFGPDPEESD